MSGPDPPNAGPIHSYRDLRVWQQAMSLAEACYRITRQFPREELYGMTSQIRQAAASVPANIAEGRGREKRGEYIQFLRVAQGSLKELETHLILSHRITLTSVEKCRAASDSMRSRGKDAEGVDSFVGEWEEITAGSRLLLPTPYLRVPTSDYSVLPACVTYSANKPNTAKANTNLAAAGTNEGDRKASMTPATISIGTMPSARRTPCPP